MKCNLLLLSAYMDGELDSTRQAEVATHLVGCARCRMAEEELRSEAHQIGELPLIRVPDDQATTLMREVGLLGKEETLPSRTVPTTAPLPTLPPLPTVPLPMAEPAVAEIAGVIEAPGNVVAAQALPFAHAIVASSQAGGTVASGDTSAVANIEMGSVESRLAPSHAPMTTRWSRMVDNARRERSGEIFGHGSDEPLRGANASGVEDFKGYASVEEPSWATGVSHENVTVGVDLEDDEEGVTLTGHPVPPTRAHHGGFSSLLTQRRSFGAGFHGGHDDSAVEIVSGEGAAERGIDMEEAHGAVGTALAQISTWRQDAVMWWLANDGGRDSTLRYSQATARGAVRGIQTSVDFISDAVQRIPVPRQFRGEASRMAVAGVCGAAVAVLVVGAVVGSHGAPHVNTPSSPRAPAPAPVVAAPNVLAAATPPGAVVGGSQAGTRFISAYGVTGTGAGYTVSSVAFTPENGYDRISISLAGGNGQTPDATVGFMSATTAAITLGGVGNLSAVPSVAGGVHVTAMSAMQYSPTRNTYAYEVGLAPGTHLSLYYLATAKQVVVDIS